MFHSLKTMFRSAPKAARRPAKRTSLRLECLEDRATPSSFNHVFVAGFGNSILVDGSVNHVVVIGNFNHVNVQGSFNSVVIVP